MHNKGFQLLRRTGYGNVSETINQSSVTDQMNAELINHLILLNIKANSSHCAW